ncbi:hypothetical protein [Paraburkholderia haematera]|nr:hypothetical protein [Paraburkholderia haematera]
MVETGAIGGLGFETALALASASADALPTGHQAQVKAVAARL